MMLPNADRAIVQPSKLRDYCLSPTHPYGKHKARLFLAALGVSQEDWPTLSWALLDAARRCEARLTKRDAYGQSYEMIAQLSVSGRTAKVLIVWQIDPLEDVPHLITCYPVR